MGEGKKFDGGKLPIYQGVIDYFPQAIQGAAESSQFGAVKYDVPYSDKNWAKVENAERRYLDALMRHLMDYLDGEKYADDSKLSHISAFVWNALAYSQLQYDKGAAKIGGYHGEAE